MKPIKTSFLTLSLSILLLQTASATDLMLKNYIAAPEHFGVTSTLIEGEKEAILVNAQFSKSEALKITADILDSGKTLKTIFVSYGDPDFYFALDVFKTYFPNVKIIATPHTVKHIQTTQQGKMAYWAPQMGANAPSKIYIPESYTAKNLELEGQQIQIRGQDEYTYLWLPQIKAVVGGISVTSGSHLWMADTPKPKDRAQVVNTLKDIKNLQPNIVIPSHTAQGAPQNLEAVNFSLDYLSQFEQAAAQTKDSEALIQEMKKRYPDLAGDSNLELGAKVVKGEMQWP